MFLCASTLSNKSLMEEATKCLFRTSLRSTHSTRMCFTVSGHWQVPHSGKSSFESRKDYDPNRLNEYDEYAVYLAILNQACFRFVFTHSRPNRMQFISSAAIPYFLPLVKYQLSYTRIHMSVAGSFIRMTGKESADFAAASAFSLPRTWEYIYLASIV